MVKQVLLAAVSSSLLSISFTLADDGCSRPTGYLPVRTPADLAAIVNDPTAKYAQCNDIDLAHSGVYNIPLSGGYMQPTGEYDGQNFSLRNFGVGLEGNAEVRGLFGHIYYGSVKQVRLIDVAFAPGADDDGSAHGALAGSIDRATIRDVEVSGSADFGLDGHCGLMVGRGLSSTIERFTLRGAVRGECFNLGGVMGFAEAMLQQDGVVITSVTKPPSATNVFPLNVGGLAGVSNGGHFRRMKVGVNVTAGVNAGGLVGLLETAALSDTLLVRADVRPQSPVSTSAGCFAGRAAYPWGAGVMIRDALATNCIVEGGTAGGAIGTLPSGPETSFIQGTGIENSSVRGLSRAGGLIGMGATVYITNSYVQAAVTAGTAAGSSARAGGFATDYLAGWTPVPSNQRQAIHHSYFSGAVTTLGTGSNLQRYPLSAPGGFGTPPLYAISSFFDSTLFGSFPVGTIGIGLTQSELRHNQANYLGWDFYEKWRFGQGQLPSLRVNDLRASDLNQNGHCDLLDLFRFLEAYFAGELEGDYNLDGTLDVGDLLSYLLIFFRATNG